jgi:hypothetical protein
MREKSDRSSDDKEKGMREYEETNKEREERSSSLQSYSANKSGGGEDS